MLSFEEIRTDVENLLRKVEGAAGPAVTQDVEKLKAEASKVATEAKLAALKDIQAAEPAIKAAVEKGATKVEQAVLAYLTGL